ncbi:MAG: hypothetical protein VR67_18210 [Peptococcaceae bacterium BRH_c8a]|nr:MAG: hypothetical protein VR67_18210 [Peptococcaceae bacterium BRH_c8a]
MSAFRLKFPESIGLLGLLGLIGVIGNMLYVSILKPWLTAFAAFCIFSLRFLNERRLGFPERLGLLGFLGFLGFLGYIPGAEFLKFLFAFFGFAFFFAFLNRQRK